MADAPVRLADPDPIWHVRFVEQRERLTTLLAPWLAAPIEHIGSTAVPGLRAKPIVDLLAPVHCFAAAGAALPLLQEDGWLHWPDDPNRFYRMWFLRPDPANRTHHLQVIQHDEANARALLAFRDALRADPVLRDRYAALKDRLALQHHTDREAYTDAKHDFVRSVLHAAGAAPPTRKPITPTD